jgi:hypothetical protein
MPRRLLMEVWYAEAFHWTPDTVAELPLDSYDWIPIVTHAKSEAQRMKQSAQQAHNTKPGIQRLH